MPRSLYKTPVGATNDIICGNPLPYLLERSACTNDPNMERTAVDLEYRFLGWELLLSMPKVPST